VSSAVTFRLSNMLLNDESSLSSFHTELIDSSGMEMFAVLKSASEHSYSISPKTLAIT
jgi:hypothetical protein